MAIHIALRPKVAKRNIFINLTHPKLKLIPEYIKIRKNTKRNVYKLIMLSNQ